MDITKLMVGNWVFDINNDIECQVDIKDFRNGGEYILDFYEPIPLTEKFFENNGIKKVDYDYLKPNVLFESDDKRIIVTDITNSGDGYWDVHVDNEDYETIGGCDVKYVHQFQQLLRLCGYEMNVVV